MGRGAQAETATGPLMLHPHVRYLACPHCLAAMRMDGRTLTCRQGHAFDVARQGYVSLLPPGGRTVPGDTAAMVGARARFLRTGHFAPIVEAIADAGTEALARHALPSCVVDLGAGTGHYLAHLADRLDGPYGLVAVDVSKHAMRRTARLHPGVAAVVADVRQRVPVATGIAGLVLDVFAPRYGTEIERLLAPNGALLVVVPDADHLRELVGPLGLPRVDPAKRRRLTAGLPRTLRLAHETSLRFAMRLDRDDIGDLVRMGPAAWHQGVDETADRARALPEPAAVTASVRLLVYRRAPR